MIRSVKTLTLSDDSSGGEIVVHCEYDDSIRVISQTLNVRRFYGNGSCTNEEGTDNKIEVYGALTWVEGSNGEMVLSEESKESIADAVAAFKVVFSHWKEGE
jgi:hypothetical protein